jgi:hypothetical protein
MVRRHGAMPSAIGVVGDPAGWTKQSFESECNQLGSRNQVARLTRSAKRAECISAPDVAVTVTVETHHRRRAALALRLGERRLPDYQPMATTR